MPVFRLRPRQGRPFEIPSAVEWLVVGAVAAIGGATLGYRHLLRRPLPVVRGDLPLPGLDRDVEILRDRWGVPHVYAETLHDLLLAQGYVHAQDRFWQMECLRRVGAGRIAEVVGERGLETDRFFRRIGLHRAAALEHRQLDEAARSAVEAYAAGVNAYLAQAAGRLPIEFTLLGYSPEAWRTLDSLICGKLLSWALSSNWDTELLRARLVDELGAARAAALEPAYPPGHPVVTTPGLDHSGAAASVLAHFEEAQRYLGALGSGAASNAWAVDGSRSATGRPLLANDPHLDPQMPSLWYESHLVGPALDVAGVSVPGMLGIAVGHNARIAWGITMAFADTQDLYVERLNPANPRQYEYQGRWEEVRVVPEPIRVRGRAAPLVEEVAITRHGPIISPVLDGEPRALSLRCATADPGEPCAVLDLNRARDWHEFRAALARWGGPGLNFVYADVDGNVGYQLAGHVPIRKRGQGLVPAPGWTGEHEWVGFVPPEQLPGTLNPPAHFVVSANNQIVPDGYPHLISLEWADGYRARRICDLLEARSRHTSASFQAMQGDLYSPAAAELREHMLEVAPSDETERRALALLRGWDCRIDPDSAPAALYEVWRYHLLRNVFGGKLGEQVDRYFGLGHGKLVHTNLYNHRLTSHLCRLLRDRPAEWFADAGEGSGDGGERWPQSWGEALGLSLREAVLYLRGRLGDEPAEWRWGDLHQLAFRHVLGSGPLGRVLSRGPFPVGGDTDTICQAAVLNASPFLARGSTVSYRQVIDLADFDRSVAVLPCGQSGHPGSPHYDDQLRLWRRLEYHPMPFSRRAVLAAATDRLVLRPGESRAERGVA